MMKKIRLLVFLCAALLAVPQSAWAAKIMVDAGHGGSDPGQCQASVGSHLRYLEREPGTNPCLVSALHYSFIKY